MYTKSPSLQRSRSRSRSNDEEEKQAELLPLREKSNKQEMQSEECENFDDILEIVGSKGKFQKAFLYLFLCPVIAIEPFISLGFIFMFYDPDHWCYDPGWDGLTESLEDWKTRMLPKEDGPNGLPRYSQCKMYDWNRTNVIDCPNGWVYDQTDYDNTLATEFNWVCENSHFATTVYTAVSIGHVAGNVVLGQAADKYGRKPIFFISLFIQQVIRVIGLFFVHNFTLFVIFQCIASAGFPLVYLLPSLCMAELSDNDFRSWSYSLGWAVWVAGMAALPFIAYICRSWFLLAIVTSAPGFLVFLYWAYIPESPRWLTSQGRIEEAAEIIRNIAQVNGTLDRLPEDKLDQMLKRLVEIQNQDKKSTNVGFWTLLSTWRLAKNTLLLTLSLTMNSIIYESITLNTPNMSGSQFMNFFFLSVIEIPSTWLGGYLLGTLGRRWTQVAFFLFCGIACTTAAIGSSHPDLSWMVLGSIVLAKFGITLTFLVVYLQAAEIFPTPLRTTGNAFASTVNGTISIGAPLIVYLAKIYAGAPYIAMGVFSLTGMIASAFLPETLHQLLPETLEDAKNFGKDNLFWSFRPKVSKPHSAVQEASQTAKTPGNCIQEQDTSL